MDSPEYKILERITNASASKIHLSARARREIPLRNVILASRLLDLARREQDRLMLLEAERIKFNRQEISANDWWFEQDPDTPSALLDTSTLLDTGIIDFDSSPLFTPPIVPSSTTPLPIIGLEQNCSSNNENEQTSTNDWSWLRDPKLLGYDGTLPDYTYEEGEEGELLSEFTDSEEDDEEEAEEEEEEEPKDSVVVVVVTDKQKDENEKVQTNNKNTQKDNSPTTTTIVFNKEQDWITIIPNKSNTNNKRQRQQQDGIDTAENHTKRRRATRLIRA